MNPLTGEWNWTENMQPSQRQLQNSYCPAFFCLFSGVRSWGHAQSGWEDPFKNQYGCSCLYIVLTKSPRCSGQGFINVNTVNQSPVGHWSKCVPGKTELSWLDYFHCCLLQPKFSLRHGPKSFAFVGLSRQCYYGIKRRVSHLNAEIRSC